MGVDGGDGGGRGLVPLPLPRLLRGHHPPPSCSAPSLLRLTRSSRRLRLRAAAAAAEEADVLPGPGAEGEMAAGGRLEEQPEGPIGGSQVDIGGLAFQGDMGGGGFAGGSGGAGAGGGDGNKMLDRGINTAIVLGASTYALTKLLTVDHDYWHVREPLSIPPKSFCSILSSLLCAVLDLIRFEANIVPGGLLFMIGLGAGMDDL